MTDDAVEREKGFRAWLALNDFLLEEFLTEDLPGMDADCDNMTGLRQAEAKALMDFPHVDACAENPELFDKFVRFVGECFIHGLTGHWTHRPTWDDGTAFVGVAFDWTRDTLEVPTLVTSAVARRSGDEFTFVYNNLAEDRAATAPESHRI